MADKKISALTSATTPIAGTEVLPIVQSGTTKQVSVANLTAGRTVSANNFTAVSGTVTADNFVNYGTNLVIDSGGSLPLILKINGVEAARTDTSYDWKVASGNVVMNTAAKGINFTANTPAAGMTSQLLNWYEEGTWTPTDNSGAGLTFTVNFAKYTRIGRVVHLVANIVWPNTANGNSTQISGLPFTAANEISGNISYTTAATTVVNYINGGTTALYLLRPGVNVTNSEMSTQTFAFSAVYFL